MSYYAGLHEVLDSRTIGLIKLWTFGLIIILRTLRDTHYNTILQREPIYTFSWGDMDFLVLLDS